VTKMALGIMAGSVGVAAVTGKLGHTQFVVDPADLARLREVRVVAATAIAEMRGEPVDAELRQQIADADAELAVLDEALEELDGAVHDGAT